MCYTGVCVCMFYCMQHLTELDIVDVCIVSVHRVAVSKGLLKQGNSVTVEQHAHIL